MNAKLLIVVSAAVILTGCLTPAEHKYRMELISRGDYESGTGMASTKDKEINIDLMGKVYRGTYIWDGGSVVTTATSGSARGNANASFNDRNNISNGSASANATTYASEASTTYVPGTGKGRALASSGDDSLRCDFEFRQGSGVGYCQNNSGKEYDLIIREDRNI